MLSLRKTTDDLQTVDGYISTLERRLYSELPADKAAQIVNESRAHLTDRVDDLTEA